MSGCKKASPRSHNSIQAATARWNSVNRWSNRFVSLSWLILLAACHSTPREEPRAAAQKVAAPAGPNGATAAGGGTVAANAAGANGVAAAGSGTVAGNAAAAPTVPVPDRAAQ